MLETYLRPFYQKVCVQKIAEIFKFIPAAFITLLALLTGVAVCPALYFHYNSVAVFLLLFSGYLDTLDGTVARLQHKSSNTGCVFDIISDRIVEFAIVLGLFLISPVSRGIYCISLLGSILVCVSSFLVISLFSIQYNTDRIKSFNYSPGLIERAEAFIFFTAMIIMPQYFNRLAVILIFLISLTSLLRIMEFIKLDS